MTGRYKIGSAPNGDKTTIAGTEKIPIDGSYYTTPAEIQTYTRGLDNAYVIRAGFASSNPADATTYFFGCFTHTSPSTTAAGNRIYIMRSGTICAADVFLTGSTGSTETSTISIRLNNTTDTTISSAVALNTSPFHAQNTALSVSVSTGDYVEIKWVTPTWGTNPTSVLAAVHLFVK